MALLPARASCPDFLSGKRPESAAKPVIGTNTPTRPAIPYPFGAILLGAGFAGRSSIAVSDG
ncbi:hypothetical protein [Azospirillum endophyticum]